MNLEMGDDLLTDLPHSIIESILMRMPIRDAVKTSVLSSKWRYKWTKITRLIFDDNLLSADKDPEEVELEDIEKFITHTLLLHKGPIHRFQLSVSVFRSCPDIDQWILYLSRNGVKELILDLGEGDWWRVPSCLFNCKKMVNLELRRCEIYPPSSFKGFSCLKSLSLHEIVIPPEATEFLISSCPLLENLSLSYFDNLELHIEAPKLKYLTLEGEFRDIILVNTPLLVSVSVCMYMNDDFAEHLELNHGSTFAKFLGAVPLLESLDGHVYFTKYLSIGHDFGRFPITFNYLKVVELYQVSFEDIKEIQVVIRLLVSSPILQTLTVSVSPSLYGSESVEIFNWDTEHGLSDSKLEHLRHVRITDLLDNPNELLFIQFLLERSPVLESLKISTSGSLKAGREKLLIQLLRFRRASTRAEIVVLPEPKT
uniref:FBD domain-containing protein n=1 Tax=Kalanchoe fedtschenkoi TaxID=63787 RepID=A0A7N0UM21_KALFE